MVAFSTYSPIWRSEALHDLEELLENNSNDRYWYRPVIYLKFSGYAKIVDCSGKYSWVGDEVIDDEDWLRRVRNEAS